MRVVKKSLLARHFDALARLKPGSAKAQAITSEIENLCTVTHTSGGAGAIAALLAEARPPSVRRLVPGRSIQVSWEEKLPDGRRLVLEVWVSRDVCSSSMKYLPATESIRPKRAHLEREPFYERFNKAFKREQAGKQLSAADRTALLIGELEADVNNGGFCQYFGNKGRRRAKAALRELEAVGAKSTASLLRTALARKSTPNAFEDLDDRFIFNTEDVALLTIHYLAK